MRNKLRFDLYEVESALKASRDVVTVKFKEMSAIHEASDLCNIMVIFLEAAKTYTTLL